MMFKRNKLILNSILFIAIFLGLIFTENVYAVDSFPASINGNISKRSDGMYEYLTSANTSSGKVSGVNLFGKIYSSSIGGGKAFCTSFKDKAPGYYPVFKEQKCTLLSKWPEAVSAGVGAIIYNARNADGSMSWDNYYLAEIAINKFLYNIEKGAYGTEKNNVPVSTSISSNAQYKKLYNAGVTAYNNYKASNGGVSVTLSNSTVEANIVSGTEVFDAASNTTTADVKIKVSVDATCLNKSGDKTSCNFSERKVTIDGASYDFSSSNGEVKVVDKVVKLSKEITVKKTLKNSNEEGSSTPTVGKVDASFKVKNKIPFQLAANYNCGKNSAGETLQSLSPNLLRFVNKTYEKTSSGQDTFQLERANLIIKKLDANGNLLAGAKIQVYSSNCDVVLDDSEVTDSSASDEDNIKSNTCDINHIKFADGSDTIVTDGTPIVINNLVVGQDYTVVEEAAPAGFVNEGITQNITITAGENEVVFKNYQSSIKISKQDITSHKELPGAELEILNSNGTSTNFKWTSSDKQQEISGLPDGDYILVERTAPRGYSVSESVNFTIENGKLKDDEDNTVVMYDSVVVEVEDTFTTQNVISMIVGLALVLSGTGIFVYAYKKKKTA